MFCPLLLFKKSIVAGKAHAVVADAVKLGVSACNTVTLTEPVDWPTQLDE
jgi:hypothetical protein